MEQDLERRRVIAFRAPPDMARAVDAATAEAGCSVSDVARGALLRDLRARGFLPPVQGADT